MTSKQETSQTESEIVLVVGASCSPFEEEKYTEEELNQTLRIAARELVELEKKYRHLVYERHHFGRFNYRADKKPLEQLKTIAPILRRLRAGFNFRVSTHNKNPGERHLFKSHRWENRYPSQRHRKLIYTLMLEELS